MNSALGDDLDAFLQPIGAQRFFSEYWNRKAVYIPGTANKFDGLFDRKAFDAATLRCELLKVNYAQSNGWPSEMPIRPDQIPEMLGQGRTVCAGGVEKVDPNLAAFLERFSRHFVQMGKFLFNSYLSPVGKGFGLHFDDHPVWILQIDGEKQWWYSAEPGLKKLASTVSFPPGVNVQNLAWGTVKRPDESSFLEIVLRPGDLLYMPKGVWHRASAVGSSMALTLAELCATPMDVIQHAIGPRFQNDLSFQDPLPGFWKEDGTLTDKIPPQLQAAFESSLEQLRTTVSALTVADLYETWRRSKVREL